MIWNPDAQPCAARSSVVAHITSEVDAVCGGGVLSGLGGVEEMARAVEQYIEEFAGVDAVDGSYLVMLASQALSDLGEASAARRLLLFGTGLVRPSEWEVTGGQAMWVVDLKQITVRPDAALELLLFNSLRLVIDAIAEVWDPTAGSGVLGLRHVSSTASALLISPAKRDVLALVSEIKDLCTRKLGRAADERGWLCVPVVMDLDM